MKILLTSLLLTLSSFCFSQDTLKWVTLNRHFTPNIPMEVVVQAINFKDIASFQYGIKYDTSALKLDSVSFFNALPGYNISLFGFDWDYPYLISPGNITTIWVGLTGTSLPHATQVYRLHFTTKTSGHLSDVLWASTEEVVFEAINKNLQEIPSVFRVITEGGLAVVEPNVPQEVYPNPASNYINVLEFSKIYDLSGNLVAAGSGLINLNLLPGLYLVVTDKGMTKLIINNE